MAQRRWRMANEQRMLSAPKPGNNSPLHLIGYLLSILHIGCCMLHDSRILDEFEKAKQAYEASLAAAKSSSQSKLRDGASANEDNSAAAAAANVQTTLEAVVDAFLTDPVNFKAGNVAPKKTLAQEAVNAIAIDREKDDQGHRVLTEDIKNRHREKEQLLVRLHHFNDFSVSE